MSGESEGPYEFGEDFVPGSLRAKNQSGKEEHNRESLRAQGLADAGGGGDEENPAERLQRILEEPSEFDKAMKIVGRGAQSVGEQKWKEALENVRGIAQEAIDDEMMNRVERDLRQEVEKLDWPDLYERFFGGDDSFIEDWQRKALGVNLDSDKRVNAKGLIPILVRARVAKLIKDGVRARNQASGGNISDWLKKEGFRRERKETLDEYERLGDLITGKIVDSAGREVYPPLKDPEYHTDFDLLGGIDLGEVGSKNTEVITRRDSRERRAQQQGQQEQREQQPQQPQVQRANVDEMVEAQVRAEEERLMKAGRAVAERFERAEGKRTRKLDLEQLESQKPYWESLTKSERDVWEARVTVNNLAVAKDRQSKDLETYAGNEEVRQFSKEVVRTLYVHMDGYKEGLEKWVDVFHNSEKPENRLQFRGEEVSVREITDEDGATAFRNLVDKHITQVIHAKRGSEIMDKIRREAKPGDNIRALYAEALNHEASVVGNVVLSTLYGTNAFEAWVYRWDKKRERLDAKQNPDLLVGRFVHGGLVWEMNPLNGLIFKAQVGEIYGVHGEWAMEQMKGIKREDYDSIQVVHAKGKPEAKSKYWRVHGRVLYVPEAYPINILGSVWDETKINDKTLTEYLLAGGEEGRINWNGLETDEFSQKYGRTIGRANKILGYQTKGSAYRNEDLDWDKDIPNAFEKRRHLDTEERRRWLYYARKRIDPRSNVPIMMGDYSAKSGYQLHMKDSEYLKSIFWSWDGPKTKVRRGWKRLLFGKV